MVKVPHIVGPTYTKHKGVAKMFHYIQIFVKTGLDLYKNDHIKLKIADSIKALGSLEKEVPKTCSGQDHLNLSNSTV